MGITFITDSMIDIQDSAVDKHSYSVLPIPIVIGEKEYSDGIDITTEKLLKLATDNPDHFPKTAQVPAVLYKEEFEKALKSGDDVICLTLSSGLSGTYQTACLMAQDVLEDYPDGKIEIIDSKSATIGMALILMQGLKLYQLHKPFDQIVSSMRFMADHVNIFFMVGDIQWLAKGGRLNKGAAMIGDLLKIVPILYFVDGKILVFDKVRGQKKAFKRIIETTLLRAAPNKEQIIGILAPPNSKWIEKTIHDLSKKQPGWSYMVPEKGAGPALAVHIGGDYLGICFFDELPEDYVPVV